jgi:hypothetical protein
VVEEDSPGNYTLSLEENKIIIRSYDRSGRERVFFDISLEPESGPNPP